MRLTQTVLCRVLLCAILAALILSAPRCIAAGDQAGAYCPLVLGRQEASRTKPEPPQPVSLAGIPFLAEKESYFAKNKTARYTLDARARRIFLLGMTNSIDRGAAAWANPLDHTIRLYVGDTLGEIRLKYEDGVVERYPLVIGEGLWYGPLFREFPEPFLGNPKSRRALEQALRLYPPRPTLDGRYLAVIAPRPVRITGLELVDAPNKIGMPLLTGVTVDPLAAQADQDSRMPELDSATKACLRAITARPLRKAGTDEARAQRRLVRLRDAFYTTTGNFPRRHVPLEMPAGYDGPRVSFKGDVYADILTNIFHHNVKDMLDKLDGEGMYHTSTERAANYGVYDGCGTYRDHCGMYHEATWTRDMGRALGEVTALGYLDRAQLCAEHTLFQARAWEEGNKPEFKLQGPIKLEYKGQRLPRHICRRQNFPDTTVGQGCFENDGHGLVSLFVYNLWRRLPTREAWLRANWDDVQGLGDWVVWQLANPAISNAGDGVLWTDSEAAFGQGNTIYADYACIEALHGLAVMADSIGRQDKAAAWRQAAEKLTRGNLKTYLINDPKYGRTWTLAHSGWANQSTVLGPIILAADRRGFAPRPLDATWQAANEAAYQRLVDKYRPFGFYGVAMGYGQGFVTQSALLLDRMQEAQTMLEWTAKATYSPFFKPYIVPEGCDLDPQGRFWFRTCDLGNGVQQAEIVKMLRIVIGVDDSDPGLLRLYPRPAPNWREVTIENYPALLAWGGKVETTRLAYTLRRGWGGRLSLAVKAGRELGGVEVRLGPLTQNPSKVQPRLNGQVIEGQIEHSGDSDWVRVRLPAGLKQFKLTL